MQRIIRLIQKLGRRRDDPIIHNLAKDLGIPHDVADRVLQQTAAELDALAAVDDASDARPIITKSMDELAKYGYHARPHEEAIMERCLEQLPERDLNILRLFKQGKKHIDIAALVGIDVPTVRRSLVKTYTDIRMKMRDFEDDGGDDGGGQPVAAEKVA